MSYLQSHGTVIFILGQLVASRSYYCVKVMADVETREAHIEENEAAPCTRVSIPKVPPLARKRLIGVIKVAESWKRH